MTPIQVMLAAKCSDVKTLRFPKLASPKLDGIRATVRGGKLMTRKMKLIPNPVVQAAFGNRMLEGADGELMVGAANAPDVFRTTGSAVMSHKETPGTHLTQFHLFDVVDTSAVYHDRYRAAQKLANRHRKGVVYVPHILVSNIDDLLGLEEGYLEQGYEGIMLRSLDGPYKHGRSTEREGYLLKLKRFEDSEAIVLGFEEKMHNANAATRDALGRTKRTSHKAGKVGTDTLGALLVRDIKTGVEFNVGTGFDDKLRAEIWERRAYYRNKIVKYRFFPTGSKDRPRFPVFHGFRDKRDM